MYTAEDFGFVKFTPSDGCCHYGYLMHEKGTTMKEALWDALRLWKALYTNLLLNIFIIFKKEPPLTKNQRSCLDARPSGSQGPESHYGVRLTCFIGVIIYPLSWYSINFDNNRYPAQHDTAGNVAF